MGLARRRLPLDRDDTLRRLSTTKFERTLRDPANHSLPVLARRRARMADVIVEKTQRMRRAKGSAASGVPSASGGQRRNERGYAWAPTFSWTACTRRPSHTPLISSVRGF
jgi:hypothetical protein